MVQPEPAYAHGTAPTTAVVLCNLGTPDAPTPAAVRRYLAEFLSDSRVVEIPRALWWPILHGVVLRVRPAKSARKYARIWTPQGSPLRVWTERQAQLLAGYLGQRGHRVDVQYAMRYGTPSIAAVLDQVKAGGADRILVLPLYPQYAASTTASAMDAVYAHVRTTRRMPALRAVDCFHDDPGYIRALARVTNDYWTKHGRPDRVVLSFHGLPRRVLDLGDPYHCHCQKTARLLGVELGLDPAQFTVTFQSRFGKAEWLKPYTVDVLHSLAKEGHGRVDVVCPGFVSDCLETLEEIGIEGRASFMAAGGRDFHLIPCLNEHPQWIDALTDLVLRHLQGWLDAPPDAAERAATRARAVAMGARK